MYLVDAGEFYVKLSIAVFILNTSQVFLMTDLPPGNYSFFTYISNILDIYLC